MLSLSAQSTSFKNENTSFLINFVPHLLAYLIILHSVNPTDLSKMSQHSASNEQFSHFRLWKLKIASLSASLFSAGTYDHPHQILLI